MVFRIATFCDLREWGEFSEKVKEKTIIHSERVESLQKSNETPIIVLTEIFESNYFFFNWIKFL